MKPNLPDKKVNLVLVDQNISEFTKKLLSSQGIDYIETIKVESISDSTSTHPDMQFIQIGENEALVEASVFSYYKKHFPFLNLTPVSDIKSPYPDDCILNLTLINNKCFLTDFQKKSLQNLIDFDFIFVKQGYTKCNICILNENAVLTSDKGILEKAAKNGFRAYFLPDNEIGLNGYKNGFWGGCSGLIDKNKILFNGNIENLSVYKELIKILENEKIEPVYQTSSKLCDNGSIIPII